MRCTGVVFSAPMTLNSPPSLPARTRSICCGEARPLADRRLRWPSFSSRVMRARRESRLCAEAGAARRTAKIRTWLTRDMGLRSQDRGKFNKVTAQNGTCEALAQAGTVLAIYWHSLDFPGDDPCRVIVFCGS